jgi:cation transport ATPase
MSGRCSEWKEGRNDHHRHSDQQRQHEAAGNATGRQEHQAAEKEGKEMKEVMWAVKSMWMFAAAAMFFFAYEFAKFFASNNLLLVAILVTPIIAGWGIVMLMLVFSKD